MEPTMLCAAQHVHECSRNGDPEVAMSDEISNTKSRIWLGDEQKADMVKQQGEVRCLEI